MDDLGPYKSWMTADLFHVGDIVSPTFGALRGVRGVVSGIGHAVAIMFPQPVRKYADTRPRDTWCYLPENVRLEAFPRRGFSHRAARRGTNLREDPGSAK